MTKIVLIVIFIIAALLVGLYAWYGGFRCIGVRTETAGGETVVVKKVTGDYKQTSSVTDEVYRYLLDDLHIGTRKGIGIFYDDPKQVEKAQLRSEAGCVIEPEDVPKLDAALCRYEIKRLPRRESAVAEFPFKGGISVWIGILRVYPALEKQARGTSPVVEIYDVPGRKIIYRK